MTISADQLRCPAILKSGACIYPAPSGITAPVRERRWRRSLSRLLGRGLTEEEYKYLKGSEVFHWFVRQSALNRTICVDEPVDEDGQEIRGPFILEAWLYVAFDRNRPVEPPPRRTRKQTAAMRRMQRGVERGRIRAPAFAERVAPPRTIRPDGVRTGEEASDADRAAGPGGKAGK